MALCKLRIERSPQLPKTKKAAKNSQSPSKNLLNKRSQPKKLKLQLQLKKALPRNQVHQPMLNLRRVSKPQTNWLWKTLVLLKPGTRLIQPCSARARSMTKIIVVAHQESKKAKPINSMSSFRTWAYRNQSTSRKCSCSRQSIRTSVVDSLMQAFKT